MIEKRNAKNNKSRNIDADVHPVYTSQKIKGKTKPKEHKPPTENQQNLVYYFKCGLCDADYVDFMSRHLHQRVKEHKWSTIGNNVKDEMERIQRQYCKQFYNPKVVPEQTRLFDLRDVFYWPPKAEDPCEVICLIISLLNTFYCF